MSNTPHIEIAGPLTLRLVVNHKLPSLNLLLAMNHWQRMTEKHVTQDAFLYALQASASDSSTEAISTGGLNIWRTAAFTLASYLGTRRKKSTFRSGRLRSKRDRKRKH